jgi:XTP/dITP diphosphohydrolase
MRPREAADDPYRIGNAGMRTLYVATSNPGKLRDFAAAAESDGIAIEPLFGLKEIPAPAEDEPTFAGNARVKAVYYSRFLPGEVVLADDSGLEVDALGGEPGVRSARYAEDAKFVTTLDTNFGQSRGRSFSVDERNNLYLLSRLGLATERRGRYHCVLAAAQDGECMLTGEGSVEGEILVAPRGAGGFGYDPLFYLPELGKTMAQIDLETKYQISHRGRALRDLLGRLRR